MCSVIIVSSDPNHVVGCVTFETWMRRGLLCVIGNESPEAHHDENSCLKLAAN